MQDEKKKEDRLGSILSILGVLLLAFALGVQGLRANSKQVEIGDVDPVVEVVATETTIPVAAEVVIEETPEPAKTEVPEVVETEEVGPQFDENITYIPEILRIPLIDLEVNVLPVEQEKIVVDYVIYLQWQTVDDDVAWHNTSATLGIPGNTVLSGHHNVGAMPFKELYTLEIGTIIEIESNGLVFEYEIIDSMILPELTESMEVRLKNAEWMEETDDERVTLITCWPQESNTHRVIVVARPLD